MNLDQSQETCMKKEHHFPSTNSKLFSVPQKKYLFPPKKDPQGCDTEQEKFKCKLCVEEEAMKANTTSLQSVSVCCAAVRFVIVALLFY